MVIFSVKWKSIHIATPWKVPGLRKETHDLNKMNKFLKNLNEIKSENNSTNEIKLPSKWRVNQLFTQNYCNTSFSLFCWKPPFSSHLSRPPASKSERGAQDRERAWGQGQLWWNKLSANAERNNSSRLLVLVFLYFVPYLSLWSKITILSRFSRRTIKRWTDESGDRRCFRVLALWMAPTVESLEHATT